jgi:hypothetical protein
MGNNMEHCFFYRQLALLVVESFKAVTSVARKISPLQTMKSISTLPNASLLPDLLKCPTRVPRISQLASATLPYPLCEKF